MGAALIHGWLAADLLKHADIIDPMGVPESLLSHENLFHVKQMAEAELIRTDIVILCVKPQIMDVVCAGLKNYIPSGVPVLSIAAGKDIAYYEQQFSANTPLIRVMPNLPATVGKGISALYANKAVSAAHKNIAQELMNAVGQTLWLDDESHMDAVTALSGSGPAYIFYMIEAMSAAGEKIGLTTKQASMLARQTVIGAAALADAATDVTVEELRQSVASKGGTTEAALTVLMDGRFQDLMDKAIQAAHDRGKELAN
ncbi:MAG: pyrroline-5-carboxylate reductase [Alphaproteobacteria bacterium]